jgi:hypothetical protein
MEQRDPKLWFFQLLESGEKIGEVRSSLKAFSMSRSSCGVAARTGDFLIEVVDVKNVNGAKETNVLFPIPAFCQATRKDACCSARRSVMPRAICCRWTRTAR